METRAPGTENLDRGALDKLAIPVGRHGRRADEALSGLVEAIEGSAALARQIAEGTCEQTAGLDDIVRALADSTEIIESAHGETSRIESETRAPSQLAAQLRTLAC